MLVAIVATAMLQQDVLLKPGLVISKSTTVKRNEYIFPNADDTATQGAILIKGDDIVVDFSGATLRGTPEDVEPDERKGTGLTIEGKNVTVKNLNVHGYKVAIAARNSEGLKVIDCDLSYNWKQRLNSTLDREDGSDWMSFHTNENDEWLRFGAAIYLRNCDKFEVQGCTARGGQCGLMVTASNDGLAWNNDFSFLSAIGLGMYGSSRNRIMHNNIDWCVRGYSHGVYNRGQDSAGILVYEQSNNNVFAYNSVTHGGDGFFLWAGQTTMDTGKGGCNGNLLYGNDFSHAPTNGIEATFSSNNFVNNLVMECWHGIWGGYSWQSKVIGNTFALNAEGIAWEHGQENQFLYNMFDKDRMAMNVWQKDTEDPNWGYAKQRDTRSRDNFVAFNTFRDIAGPVVRLSRSLNFHFTDNRVSRTAQIFQTEKETEGLVVERNRFETPYKFAFPPETAANTWDAAPSNVPATTAMQASGNLDPDREPVGAAYLRQFQVGWKPFVPTVGTSRGDVVRPWAPAPLSGGKDPFLKPGATRGRRYILIDHWGPYDFQHPILWPRSLVSTPGTVSRDERGLERRTGPLLEQRLDVLGPAGDWKIVQTRGARSVSAYSGKVPGSLVVHMEPGKANDVLVELTYTGQKTTDYRGIETAAGRPVKFSFSRFFAPIDWTVKWFTYNGEQDPRKTTDWSRIIKGVPAHEVKVSELNFAWPGSPGGTVPPDHFLTLAEGAFEIAPGDYVLDLTSDDGVRVSIDGKIVHEDWTWHGPKSEKIPIRLGGRHTIRIEHFELDGYSTLKAVLDRKR